ncbi:MAG: nuclear transport factor 2 family protein [Novosphingobium sp.]
MATEPAELAIRLQRAAFNRALAAGDLDAIAPLLDRNAVLVTGTDSAVITGRKAQLAAWRREFAAADATVYSRLPTVIEASPIEPIALEHGKWTGVSKSGRPVASGTYVAKWRLTDGHWIIEAEIYLTLA